MNFTKDKNSEWIELQLNSQTIFDLDFVSLEEEHIKDDLYSPIEYLLRHHRRQKYKIIYKGYFSLPTKLYKEIIENDNNKFLIKINNFNNGIKKGTYNVYCILDNVNYERYYNDSDPIKVNFTATVNDSDLKHMIKNHSN